MLKSAGRPYVCWRCLTSGTSVPSVAGGSRHALGAQASVRSYTNYRKGYQGRNGGYQGRYGGNAEGWPDYRRRGPGQNELSLAELSAIREKSNIRERLRSWEAENHIPARRLFEDLPAQEIPLNNFLTRPDMLPGATDSLADDDVNENRSARNRALYDGDELEDLRSSTSALLAGDLVESRYGAGRMPLLGICLGRHYGHQYFYMSTGEVIAEDSLRTLFTVPNYIKPSKFRRLLDIIPEVPVRNPRNVLVHRNNPGALEDVAQLQEEINKFFASAAEFYHENPSLDWAINQVAHPTKPLVWSLEQLANRLLAHRHKDEGTGRYPPHILYAVHTALQREEWGFRTVNVRLHRRNYMYEARSASDMNVIRKVEEEVRQLVQEAARWYDPARSETLLRKNGLGVFILRARSVIEKHRKRRQWTPHGMVGPSDETLAPEDVPSWPEEDREYIRFMELWACHRIVSKASQLETLGATILRLTDMYTEGDWLAHWTGFSFLQEIGWIPPYEIPARYQYRLPGATVARGQPMRLPQIDVEKAHVASLRPDIAEGHRRDWGDATIFCVDAESTDDVDDGFSIEPAKKPGEYWIHIHIADPAAFIDPHSKIVNRLGMAPSSLYLAGFNQKMMPESLEKRFSLDPDKPVLTFSAKVNESGKMLAHKIEPGVVHRVLHVPKSEVAAILPGFVGSAKTDSPFAPFSVGKQPPPPPAPAKQITKAADLPQKDRDDLLLLNRLCKALKHHREAKGQLPPFQARFADPQVSLASVVPVVAESSDADRKNAGMAWSGDPYISFSPTSATEADRLVERLMHTCGEVAATWCAARGIPVPYSFQPEALRNAAELREFRRAHVEPLVAANRPIPVETLHSLFTLVGTSELSLTPQPFYSVGVDAYAKASSPLRRFGDLLVHWQIHAALAHERSTGTSLRGKNLGKQSNVLPWNNVSMGHKLPLLQALQRQVREVDNRDGPLQWMAQAVLRAWRFGEAPLPETFTFVVDGLYPFGLKGRLTSFYNLPASVDAIRLGDLCKVADVEVDDAFEAKIFDVNAVTAKISLQPLRRMGKHVPGAVVGAASAPAAKAPASKVAAAGAR